MKTFEDKIFQWEALTSEDAIELGNSEIWREWDADKIFRVQLFQRFICFPMEEVYKAGKKVLGRPIFSHEFMNSNRENLLKEYLGAIDTPTLSQIIELIPESKRIEINI